MIRRLGSFALVVLLLGCSSLTRPDGDDLGSERVEPASTMVVSPPTTIANPTNEGNAANGTTVALAAQPAQPATSPPAAKQGG